MYDTCKKRGTNAVLYDYAEVRLVLTLIVNEPTRTYLYARTFMRAQVLDGTKVILAA